MVVARSVSTRRSASSRPPRAPPRCSATRPGAAAISSRATASSAVSRRAPPRPRTRSCSSRISSPSCAFSRSSSPAAARSCSSWPASSSRSSRTARSASSSSSSCSCAARRLPCASRRPASSWSVWRRAAGRSALARASSSAPSRDALGVAPRAQRGLEPLALGLDAARSAARRSRARLELGREAVALGLAAASALVALGAPRSSARRPRSPRASRSRSASPARCELVRTRSRRRAPRPLAAQLGDLPRSSSTWARRSLSAPPRCAGGAGAAAAARRRGCGRSRARRPRSRRARHPRRTRRATARRPRLAAGQALAAPAGVDGQRRPRDPAAAHAVPAADDLEPVVGGPLEALELERDLTDRRHQLGSPASGGSGEQRRARARDGRAGLGRRRAVVDGGDAPAPVTALDGDRERDLAEAQQRADRHHDGAARSASHAPVPRSACSRADGGRDHWLQRPARRRRRRSTARSGGRRSPRPASAGRRGDERGDRQRGEDEVGDLEHLPGVQVAEPVEEQATRSTSAPRASTNGPMSNLRVNGSPLWS